MLSTISKLASPFRLFFTTIKSFRIKPHKISDLNYFMKVIKTPHELQETNKLLKAIKTGGAGIYKHNFETISKKYIYYVRMVYLSENYKTATIQEKIDFLDYMTEIYENLGRISGQHLIRVFNKISKELINSSEVSLPMKISVIRSISRYNVKRASFYYHSLERFLTKPQFLKDMEVNTSLTLLNIFSNIKFYNRLLV